MHGSVVDTRRRDSEVLHGNASLTRSISHTFALLSKAYCRRDSRTCLYMLSPAAEGAAARLGFTANSKTRSRECVSRASGVAPECAVQSFGFDRVVTIRWLPLAVLFIELVLIVQQ